MGKKPVGLAVQNQHMQYYMIDELMVGCGGLKITNQLSDGALTKLGKSLDEKFSPVCCRIICIILFL